MVCIDFGLGSRRNVLSLLHKLIPVKTLRICLVIGLLTILLTACGDRLTATNLPTSETLHLPVVQGRISEVAPPDLAVVNSISLGSICTSTSSTSGIIATVAVEVWTRPLASVRGTRCTRWTPASNFSREVLN